MTYDIDAFINNNKSKTFIELYKSLNDELSVIDRIHTATFSNKNNPDRYRINNYRDYIGDFLFFLNTGRVPSGIGKDGIKRFMPIINNLISIGALKESVLDVLK